MVSKTILTISIIEWNGECMKSVRSSALCSSVLCCTSLVPLRSARRPTAAVGHWWLPRMVGKALRTQWQGQLALLPLAPPVARCPPAPLALGSNPVAAVATLLGCRDSLPVAERMISRSGVDLSRRSQRAQHSEGPTEPSYLPRGVRLGSNHDGKKQKQRQRVLGRTLLS